jgi:hypothetical protein
LTRNLAFVLQQISVFALLCADMLEPVRFVGAILLLHLIARLVEQRSKSIEHPLAVFRSVLWAGLLMFATRLAADSERLSLRRLILVIAAAFLGTILYSVVDRAFSARTASGAPEH